MHMYNTYMYIQIQWSLSVADTLGTALTVLIKGDVLISGGVLYIAGTLLDSVLI